MKRDTPISDSLPPEYGERLRDIAARHHKTEEQILDIAFEKLNGWDRVQTLMHEQDAPPAALRA